MRCGGETAPHFGFKYNGGVEKIVVKCIYCNEQQIRVVTEVST